MEWWSGWLWVRIGHGRDPTGAGEILTLVRRDWQALQATPTLRCGVHLAAAGSAVAPAGGASAGLGRMLGLADMLGTADGRETWKRGRESLAGAAFCFGARRRSGGGRGRGGGGRRAWERGRRGLWWSCLSGPLAPAARALPRRSGLRWAAAARHAPASHRPAPLLLSAWSRRRARFAVAACRPRPALAACGRQGISACSQPRYLPTPRIARAPRMHSAVAASSPSRPANRLETSGVENGELQACGEHLALTLAQLPVSTIRHHYRRFIIRPTPTFAHPPPAYIPTCALSLRQTRRRKKKKKKLYMLARYFHLKTPPN